MTAAALESATPRANISSMAKDDDDFKPKVGRPRADRSGERTSRKVLSLQRRVVVAFAKAGGDPRRMGKTGRGGGKTPRNGRYNAHGRGAKVVRTLPRDTGWKFDHSSGQRLRMRRVIVKARYVKLKGPQSRAGYAHLRYLQRDGVSRENEPGQLYGRALDVPDGPDFLDRSTDDRHQFRLIVAPEDGVELGNLRRFTRELMGQMERDLETRLDWVAVDHHNTGHPHTHIVIRGVTEDGKALNIAGDYIAHGIRHRASELLTRELGLQSEREVEQQLDREVDLGRLTRLDRNLVERLGDDGVIDMRPEAQMDGPLDTQRYRLLKRLKKLERLGLAQEDESGRWTLSADMDKTLRAMGERGDIIKTMHHALAERGISRSLEGYAIHREPGQVMIGMVVGKGLAADEMSDRVHVVVDGIDGRVHYAEMAGDQAEGVRIGSVVEIGRTLAKPKEADKTIAEIARGSSGMYEPELHLSIARDMERVPGGDPAEFVRAHVRRLEALRRAGIVTRINEHVWDIPGDYLQRAQDYDSKRSQQLGVRILSTFDLEAQVSANGATWLDRQLVTRDPALIQDSGFGHKAQNALTRRQHWLIEQGLARENGELIQYRANLLATLARRELNERGQELARSEGGSFHMAEDGEHISGRYKGALELVSGKYAVVETHAKEFTLVPWRPVIEKELGRTVAGIMHGDGISWEIGRSWGLGIGM